MLIAHFEEFLIENMNITKNDLCTDQLWVARGQRAQHGITVIFHS